MIASNDPERVQCRLLLLCCESVLIACGLFGQESSHKDASQPIPFTRKSVAQGKQIYLRNCVECHDSDGRALSGRGFGVTPPADLTSPAGWLHGTSEEEIYANIREGTKEEMPAFKGKLQDEQIWHLVNFVRSLWPEGSRPKYKE